MANSTKLYTHPTLSGAYLIETNQGNYEVTNDYVKKTTLNGNPQDEQVWDIAIQTVVDNARTAMQGKLSAESITLLISLCDEKIEDFDGQEA